jgi:hypothetical protein
LSVLKDIQKIYAGLNAEEVRRAAYRDLNVGILAATTAALQEMEQFLAPTWLPEPERAEALRAIHPIDGVDTLRFDFVLCQPGLAVPANGFVFSSDQHLLAQTIASKHKDLELSLARQFPLFRRPVSDRIIQRVARENAMFALATALPNVIPSVVDVPWAVGEFATDTAFLTMNQIRMALLMAAIHGRDVGYGDQKAQIGVIVAGAFGWRALARELIGKIPLGGGLIPKAAVAFAGTYVVGLGLEKINRTGRGLSKRERKDAYVDALAKGKNVVEELAPAIAKKRQPFN